MIIELLLLGINIIYIIIYITTILMFVTNFVYPKVDELKISFSVMTIGIIVFVVFSYIICKVETDYRKTKELYEQTIIEYQVDK